MRLFPLLGFPPLDFLIVPLSTTLHVAFLSLQRLSSRLLQQRPTRSFTASLPRPYPHTPFSAVHFGKAQRKLNPTRHSFKSFPINPLTLILLSSGLSTLFHSHFLRRLSIPIRSRKRSLRTNGGRTATSSIDPLLLAFQPWKKLSAQPVRGRRVVSVGYPLEVIHVPDRDIYA